MNISQTNNARVKRLLRWFRPALEYAANNIRFNTVSPGNINTPMHANDNHAALAKFHPLARMGEISDIVDAVLYLQNATFVTGENIRVDGGVHAGR
jgi:NAD(P)-dependent dehydrogenase (short-subunit alcohol dehydrogenase family)